MKLNIVSLEDEYLSLHSFVKFDDGSGCKAIVELRSGNFSCSGQDLYFDDLSQFYSELKLAYENLSGVVSLKYRYEEDQINFEFSANGHVLVTGIFNDYCGVHQRLEVGFEIDQSYFPRIFEEMESIIEAFSS